MRLQCTCGGSAPGWPQHEEFCDLKTRRHSAGIDPDGYGEGYDWRYE